MLTLLPCLVPHHASHAASSSALPKRRHARTTLTHCWHTATRSSSQTLSRCNADPYSYVFSDTWHLQAQCVAKDRGATLSCYSVGRVGGRYYRLGTSIQSERKRPYCQAPSRSTFWTAELLLSRMQLAAALLAAVPLVSVPLACRYPKLDGGVGHCYLGAFYCSRHESNPRLASLPPLAPMSKPLTLGSCASFISRVGSDGAMATEERSVVAPEALPSMKHETPILSPPHPTQPRRASGWPSSICTRHTQSSRAGATTITLELCTIGLATVQPLLLSFATQRRQRVTLRVSAISGSLC